MPRSGFHFDRAEKQERVLNTSIRMSDRIGADIVKPPAPVLSGETCPCGLTREAFKSRKEFKDHSAICGGES